MRPKYAQQINFLVALSHPLGPLAQICGPDAQCVPSLVGLGERTRRTRVTRNRAGAAAAAPPESKQPPPAPCTAPPPGPPSPRSAVARRSIPARRRGHASALAPSPLCFPRFWLGGRGCQISIPPPRRRAGGRRSGNPPLYLLQVRECTPSRLAAALFRSNVAVIC